MEEKSKMEQYKSYGKLSMKSENKNENKKPQLFQKRNISLIIFAIIASALLFLVSKSFFFIALFLLINLVFGLIAGSLGFSSIGVEVVTFSIIMTGAAFGPVAGIFMGITGRLIEAFSSKRIHSLIITLPLYAIVGFVAGIFGGAGTNIAMLGIIISMAYAIIAGFSSALILGAKPSKAVMFSLVSGVLNVLFFISIAPTVFRIMV
jgi:hypothetical protein